MTSVEPSRDARAKSPPGEASILATRFVLYWERWWPLALPGLAAIYAFLVLGLFGAWAYAPVWLHAGALALAAVFLGVLWFRKLRPLAWPDRRRAQARLEANGAARHAPLQSLDDRPFETAENPLWRAHLEASEERARAARFGAARGTGEEADPYGFRFIAIGLFCVALISAGDDWRSRIASVFAPGAGAPGSIVADLWIEPPDYTGAAPIYLLRAGERQAGLRNQVDAPEGSRLVAQANGRGRLKLSFAKQRGVDRVKFDRDGEAASGALILVESGLLRLRLAADDIRWPVGIEPDAAPIVAFSEPPAATDDGLVGFNYLAEDDYGIVTARLALRLDPGQERAMDAPPFTEAALNETRLIDVAAPRRGDSEALLDLQADPWAGLKVIATLIVEDGAGQIGESEPATFRLPARRFFNPLAKTVLEQRQTLAVSADDWRRAARSFDAVTFAPEAFYEDRPSNYMLLRAAFWRVMRQDGEGFEDAVEDFWPLALQLEDEAVELARQRLEAAQEALREAIERGANDEEVSRLTEELRDAMNDYIAALEQSGQAMEQAGGEGQSLNSSDLDQMLDSIRDLAQSGAGNAARQMLSDLENILNNMRLARGGGGSGEGRPSGEGESSDSAAGEAGDLIGRQRELADEAFDRARQGPGAPGEQGAENGDQLAEEEGALGGDLDELIERLGREGGGASDPNGEAANSLERARSRMRAAEQALRNDDFDAASDHMERAIGDLRDGADALAREEMRQAENERGGREGEGATDPLGRPVGEAYGGGGPEVPDELEEGRSRAVIEELRRRLGQPGRTDDEIDYLERLLDRF